MQSYTPIFGTNPVQVSLSELERRCVRNYPDSTCRPLIWNGIMRCYDRIIGVKLSGSLLVAGEFVTCKQEPISAMLLLLIAPYLRLSPEQCAIVGWFRSGEMDNLLCDAYWLHSVAPTDPDYDLFCEQAELLHEAFSIQPDGTRRGSALIPL